ncbi:hypothetical protein ES288_D10G284800v1 [Gossypium darwinii]|uniref:Uncharacterized protein n=1 Tax=Gossypium darwinii TaxID=34276 RepID=A0A5D2B5I7_GOSDA|nr:hypothetical protein ES288_D10G284800v1 [Gossypium darwinii]
MEENVNDGYVEKKRNLVYVIHGYLIIHLYVGIRHLGLSFLLLKQVRSRLSRFITFWLCSVKKKKTEGGKLSVIDHSQKRN